MLDDRVKKFVLKNEGLTSIEIAEKIEHSHEVTKKVLRSLVMGNHITSKRKGSLYKYYKIRPSTINGWLSKPWVNTYE